MRYTSETTRKGHVSTRQTFLQFRSLKICRITFMYFIEFVDLLILSFKSCERAGRALDHVLSYYLTDPFTTLELQKNPELHEICLILSLYNSLYNSRSGIPQRLKEQLIFVRFLFFVLQMLQAGWISSMDNWSCRGFTLLKPGTGTSLLIYSILQRTLKIGNRFQHKLFESSYDSYKFLFKNNVECWR